METAGESLPGIQLSDHADSNALLTHETAALDRLVRERTFELAVANEALEVERRRLLSLLDQIPDFFCLLAPDYTIRFANRNFRVLFGQPEGRTCYQVMRGKDEACPGCALDRIFDGSQVCHREWHSPEGKVYRIHLYPFQELDGASRVLELGIDITGFHEAEQALKLERNKFKSVLDAMEDGVYIVNREGEIQYANPALMREFGAPNGRKCYDYFHGNDSPCSSCRNKEVFAGNTIRHEWVSERNGRTYDLFGTPLRNADGTISKLEIIHDISARKQTEEELRKSEDRYRILVETMNDGLGITDERLLVTYVNQKICEMLGYEKEELLNRPATDFLDRENRNVVLQRRHERTFSPYELVWTRKDGSKLATRVSPRAIQDAEGRLLGSFAVITDISEKRRSEVALRESEQQLRSLSVQLLQAQETERSRISRELHDELGQALSLLKIRMGFLRKGLREDQERLREECDETVQYLNQVIENVRRLSRDLSPTILEDLGLGTALRRLVTQFARMGEFEVISRIEEIDGFLNRKEQINLYRIFQEALNNIRKHACARTVSVVVERQERMVNCLIEDDGIGFDTSIIAAASAAEKGMGIATIGERVRFLGGKLELTSEPGSGTRLTFSIPARNAGDL